MIEQPEDRPTEAARPAADWPVLVVDDSRLAQLSVGTRLEAWGRRVLFASSVEEALEILQREPVRVIFSDWEMPERDGLDLCRAVRARGEVAGYRYFIMLTARSRAQDITAALMAGADEFLTKPVSTGELMARLSAADRIIEMSDRLKAQNTSLAAVNAHITALLEELERDLRMAARLQSAMLPPEAASYPGADLAHVYRPAGHIGGDLVGHVRVGPRHLCAYVLDVSGHGVAAALLSVEIAQVLSAEVPGRRSFLIDDRTGGRLPADPAAVAARLNTWMSATDRDGRYITMALLTLDLETGRGRLCRAGHEPPLLIPRSGAPRFLGDGQAPIGLFGGMAYASTEVALAPGERLLLYSDGIVEAQDEDGRQLGSSGLAAVLEESRTEPPQQVLTCLLDRLNAHTGGHGAGDDVSALLVTRT